MQMTHKECQVVNLGAGYDTRFWTLTDAGQTPKMWVEVDFDAVTSNKIHYIKVRKQLHEKLTKPGIFIIFLFLFIKFINKI